MVGFEDSVNMVEETKDPQRIFPRMMFTGLGIAVSSTCWSRSRWSRSSPPARSPAPKNPEAGILLDVVRHGAPDLPIDKIFPFMTVFAVANTALINMLMASRLIYGMANQGVLPQDLGKVLPGRRSPWAAIVFTTALALGLIVVVALQAENTLVAALSGTTALLLLAVFAIVNVAVLVLRREPAERALPGADGDPGARWRVVRLPARSLGPAGGRHDPVQDRRRPARGRRRALGSPSR